MHSDNPVVMPSYVDPRGPAELSSGKRFAHRVVRLWRSPKRAWFHLDANVVRRKWDPYRE